jgi:hypothetical protein
MSNYDPNQGAPGAPYPSYPPPAPAHVPGPYQAPPQPGYYSTGKLSGLAVASLVLGITWIFWLGSILALIFGYMALSQIKKSHDRGRGLAIAGVVLGWIGMVTLVSVVALSAAVSEDDSDTSTGTTDATSGNGTTDEGATTAEPTTDAEGQDVYQVGDTAHTADLDVTVHQVQDPFEPTNEFETPQAGMRFVAVESELTNADDESITWSSLMGAELTDSENRPYTVALAGIDLPQLDGDVPAAGSRRGWVVFEVPQDATGLQVRIKGSITATGSLFVLGS